MNAGVYFTSIHSKPSIYIMDAFIHNYICKTSTLPWMIAHYQYDKQKWPSDVFRLNMLLVLKKCTYKISWLFKASLVFEVASDITRCQGIPSGCMEHIPVANL